MTMGIQSYSALLDYANAKIAENRDSKSFLVTFCEACLRADAWNFEIVRPALEILMEKYPADPARLAAERRDREER